MLHHGLDDFSFDQVVDVIDEASLRCAIDRDLSPPLEVPACVRETTPGNVLGRALDIAMAVAILILILPVALLVIVALQIGGPGPVLFAHQRIGLDGKPFACLKFRTMRVDGDAVLARHLAADADACAEWQATRKLRRDPRITPIARWVRKLSLDEFPQLINVIRGEMSIVGPRPIVAAEIDRYGDCFADYCAVRPGLTGLWQVSGRNDTSYESRVLLDRFYVLRRSFAYDVQILVRTVPTVLLARGSY